MFRIIGKHVARGRQWERCDGCDSPMPKGQTLSALSDTDDQPHGWFCPSCAGQILATGRVLLWGHCSGCDNNRTLSPVNTGDPDGPAWLCEDCRKKRQER